MSKALVASVGVAATAGAFWFMTGSGVLRQADHGHPGAQAGRILYYVDPMHPSYRSDRPGKAPDCGMDLQAVYADGDASARAGTTDGTIHVSRDRRDVIGIQTGRVERSAVTQTLRAFGRVALDEGRIFPVITSSEGWVTQIARGASTGDVVREGQPLASVFGRDYSTAQRTFLYALRASENPPPGLPGDSQEQLAITLQEATKALQGLGFTDAQIQQLTKTRQVRLDVTLAAPASGVIVARNVFQKQRFDRGAELFRIADFRHVWIVADVFGSDAEYIRSGTAVQVTLPDRPSARFRAIVSDALAHFDGGSRSLKVRLSVENPQLVLRPDMFVDLAFPMTFAETTTIPADAIVESGPGHTVFVERSDDTFEARAVETGWHHGGRVQIVRGLSPGETIVVSGHFLLDSERRLRSGNPGGHD